MDSGTQTPFSLIPHQRFRLHFECEGELYLRGYAGSALRGVFGHALRRVVCILPRQECAGCLLASQCLYPFIFETPSRETDQTFTPYPSQVPHPFVLEPPLTSGRLFSKGDSFFVGMVLMGPAIAALPYLILTFQEMGRQGLTRQRVPFCLTSMEMRQEDQWQVIYNPTQGMLLQPEGGENLDSQLAQLGEATTLQLRTLTPLRMTADNRLVRQFDFPTLLRSLLRRLDDLARLYGSGPLPVNIPELLQISQSVTCHESEMSWVDFTRYSNRQQRTQTMGGLVGSLLLTGNFVPFLKWLVLGERLHIGKATSFGFGQYQLEAMA